LQARFNGMEYVVTQPTDEYMGDDAVESVLRAEYGLLCMADTFKKAFDDFAMEQSVKTIPRMCRIWVYFLSSYINL